MVDEIVWDCDRLLLEVFSRKPAQLFYLFQTVYVIQSGRQRGCWVKKQVIMEEELGVGGRVEYAD